MFTVNSYIELLKQIRECGYHPCTFNNINEKRPCIVRHDVDMSPVKAMEMAELETELGVSSTYFIMTSSDYYNIFTRENSQAIKRIEELGHEIALHYDVTKYDLTDEAGDELAQTILDEIEILQKLSVKEIRSFSWHIPRKDMVGKRFPVYRNGKELNNAYDPLYFQGFKYVSDSMMRWREPVKEILAAGCYDKIQFLTHPIWYQTTREDDAYKIIEAEFWKRQNEILVYCDTILPGFREEYIAKR